MAKRTEAQKLADRAKKRIAEGRGLSNRQKKSANSPSPSPSPTPTRKTATGNSVKEQRAAADAANISMSAYKKQNSMHDPVKVRQERQSTATKTNGNISSYDANSVGNSKNNKYSHNDINALRSQGYSDADIGKHLNSLGSDANLGSAADRLKQRYIDSLTAPTPAPTAPTPSPSPTAPAPTPTNPISPPSPIGGGGGGTSPITPGTTIGGGGGTGGGTGGNDNDTIVNTPDNSQDLVVDQDNDITTDIDGNNNTVVNNQDNSIRQYGGDNRSFNYIGGSGNAYEDTPVSAATMAGFYDVDDSPAAQARFVDQYSTINRDNQKRFAGAGLTTSAMFDKYDARNYTDESMTNAIARSTQNSYDRADVQTGITLGDIWRPDYAPDWRMPEKPAKIENNIDERTEEANDNLDDE